MSDSAEGALPVIEAARRFLAVLIGERWSYVGRASSLVWMGFGAPRLVTGRGGGTRTVAEYALHLQCPWRVFDGDELVTGSNDVYVPRPGWTGDGDFDWDVQGANRFDVRARKLTAHLSDEEVVVTAVGVAVWGDLTFSLSNGFRIDVLRVGSVPDKEHWRFFRPYRDEEHVVVFDPDGAS